MSFDPSSPHKLYTKILSYPQDPIPSPKYQSDEVSINKELKNGFSMSFSVDELGKIKMSASNTFGEFGLDQAKIQLTVETSEHRAPSIKLVHPTNDSYTYQDNFIEIDDKLDRTTESFVKEEKSYVRKFTGSSILTVDEFFNEILPGFQQLAEEKIWDQYVPKFAQDVAKVQNGYNYKIDQKFRSKEQEAEMNRWKSERRRYD